MRQIGSIDNELDATRFGDYLLMRGIRNSVEQGAGGWDVWVEDDDQLERAQQELGAYRQNRADPRYAAAGDSAEKLRKQQERGEQRRRQQSVDVRTRWGQPSQLARPLTILLVAVCILVAIGTGLGERGAALNVLRIQPMPELPDEPTPESFQAYVEQVETAGLSALKRGEIWRAITPIFLHFSVLHLIFNVFWLLDLGSMIETRRSTWFLLLLVFASAIAGNFGEYFWSRTPNFGGMSGVVYALFGYVWIKAQIQPHLGMGMRQEGVYVMLGWLVLCMTGMIGNIANAAHLAGLVVGVAFAYVPFALNRAKRRLA